MWTTRRTPHARGVGILVGLALLLACGASGEGGPSVARPFEETGRLVEQPCWFDSAEVTELSSVRCAAFHVPLEWGTPGRELRLPVVVAGLGGGEGRNLDAIVVPGGGGPGGSVGLESSQAVDTLAFYQFLVHGTGRDLVVVDQRGAGLADPALHCPELSDATLVTFSGALTGDAEDALWADASRRCARRLEAAGLVLRAFDTKSAARDLEALRIALGYAQWNLYGASYGANLALAVARDYPGSVRSLVLESPDVPDDDAADAPRNFERVLRGLFARCAGDPKCARDYPDPSGALDRLLAALAATPRVVEVTHPHTLEPVPVQVTPARLLDAIATSLYQTQSSHELPRILTAADRGSFSLVEALVGDHVGDALDPRFAVGLLEVIACREAIPGSDLERREREARAHPWREAYRVAPDAIRTQCGAWNVGDAGPESRAAPAFPGPALLLAGALDPVIPISDVRRLAVSLPKSRLIEFPATGHDAELAWWACVDDLITEFLRDPGARTTTQPGDVACRRTANAMRFPSLGQAEKLPLR